MTSSFCGPRWVLLTAVCLALACGSTKREDVVDLDGSAAGESGATAGGHSGNAADGAGRSGTAGVGAAAGFGGAAIRDAGADAMMPPSSNWTPPATAFPLEVVKAAKPSVFAAVESRTEGISWQSDGLFLCAGPGIVHISAAGVVQKYLDTPTCGATFAAADGTLLVALGTQGVAQIFKDGRVGLLAALPAGGFTNDLTVDRAGNIYASNSSKGEVLRVTPTGDVAVVASQIAVPNGIDVDPAGQYLFVTSSTTSRVLRFALANAGPWGTLPMPIVFGPTDISNPDGCAFDAWGNLWVASQGAGSIVVLTPMGTVLSRVMGLGGDSNNLTFGGAQRDTIYMTRGNDVLLVTKGVLGFPGHPGAPAYKVLRYLDPPASLRPL